MADTSSTTLPAGNSASSISTTSDEVSTSDTTTSATSTTTTTSSTTTPLSFSTTTSSTSSSTTPTSTSSTTTEQSSSTTSTTSTTTSASSRSTSAPPTPTSTSTTPLSLSVSSSIITTTDAGGGTITMTSVFTHSVTPSTTVAGPTKSASSTSKPFLQNTAAVAGTFSAVGIVALIILIYGITAFVRRRRQRKYDDETEAAAADAYKAAHEQNPYMDDDGDYGGARSDYTAFSNQTHGTYGQPPMQPAAEAYNMQDLSAQQGYGAPSTYTAGSDNYGAAGVGAAVGPAAMQRQNSMRDSHAAPQAPYNAFAAAPVGGAAHGFTQGHDWSPYGHPAPGDPYAAAYDVNPTPAGGRSGDNAEFGSAGEYSAGARPSLSSNPSRRSAAEMAAQRGANLSRSPSQVPKVHHGANGQGYYDPDAPPLPVAAQSAQIQYAPQATSYAAQYQTSPSNEIPDSRASPNSDAEADKRRSHYLLDNDDNLGVSHSNDHHGDGASIRSEDMSAAPRVLRVANE